MRAVALFVLTISGCTSITVAPPTGDARDPRASLEPLGSVNISLPRRMSTTLEVRSVDDLGMPARGGQVLFTLNGETGGATLQADAAEADFAGVAAVELTAGPADAEFEVIASADYATPVQWTVRVTLEGTGDVIVRPDAAAQHRFAAAIVFLYEDVRCSELDPRSPPPADARQTAESLREDVRFGALEAGSEWTVLVVGVGSSRHAEASGCAEGAIVEAGADVVVDVPIAGLPVMVEGAFSLESHFFVADALPAGQGGDLAALGDIADDSDDPGAYLLDRMEDEIDDEFISWSFEAARFMGTMDMTVNDIISDWSPDVVDDLIATADALAEILEDVRIESVLTVERTDDADARDDGPDDDGEDDEAEYDPPLTATHELVAIVLELDGMVHRFSADRDAGVTEDEARDVSVTLDGTDQLHVAPHELGIDFGTLVRFAMDEVVLAQLPGRPRSLAVYLPDQLPCYWVGDELAYQVGMGSAGYWESLCERAAATIGEELEAGIMPIHDGWDTMRLEGTAEVDDDDQDMSWDSLQEGTWTASLRGPAGDVAIEATFEGAARRPLD